jgi:peroxiredoxin
VDDLLEELQGQKVGVFAVCGQPKSEVDLMMSEQNLRFKCLSDPQNVLQKWLKAQNIIDVQVYSGEGEGVYFEIKKYQPHGMVQPTVLFVKPDMSVMAKWVQIATKENCYGAKDRKPFPDIWAEAKAKNVDFLAS